MRTLMKLTILGLLFFSANACGSSGPSEADLQAEVEADQLDSVTQVIETTIEEVESDAAELESALDSLDALFPEEGQ